ncbi:armadillo repeat-containing protein 1-like isoform X2 [Colossoma macropomum]|uniref:armadillo repeat-containing protein 1-like isoform X2 n=1 Tax=Colossoma macropomum TaxID=42526 RepID=UPI001863A8F1|nr:armadillo repeat-containing protein 1-like isoform X2 [Colossoma macropomum]
MMDALSVVSQLRDLASEPQNREAIVQDQGCLPGLVLFLDHKDPQVVFTSLQTLRYLAESTQNINTMKNELGMMVTLEALKENSGLNGDITDLAKEDQRGVCEEALLKVKGVISFTFQMALKRCTVRVRADLPTESLASAIAATKVLSVQQVVKNESGEEVLIPLGTTGMKVEENSHLPDYLPEDESPEKETDRAVSRTTAKQDSSGSWLNTAASFLTKTFYW